MTAHPHPRPKINQNIREILDVQTEDWGVEVTVVEVKDIQLPESMKRAMAREAEAEREKRAKIIAAEGEAQAAGELARASDVMMEHPLALQLRNLQSLVELGVDKNTTVVFPAPLMSTIQELTSFLGRENAASAAHPLTPLPTNGEVSHDAATAVCPSDGWGVVDGSPPAVGLTGGVLTSPCACWVQLFDLAG